MKLATPGYLLAPRETSLSDTADRDNSLFPACADHHGIDLHSIFHYYEIGHNRRTAIREVEGEGACAIGVYGIGAVGRSMGEISDDFPRNRHCIELSETAVAVEPGHSDAHLRSDWTVAGQFRSTESEPVGTGDKFCVATKRVALGEPEIGSCHEKQRGSGETCGKFTGHMRLDFEVLAASQQHVQCIVPCVARGDNGERL